MRTHLGSGDRANTSRERFGLRESPSSQSKKELEKRGKARVSKKMIQEEQSERFTETARTVDADDKKEELNGYSM